MTDKLAISARGMEPANVINPYAAPTVPPPPARPRWYRAVIPGTIAFACIAAASWWVFGTNRPPYLGIFLIVASLYWLWLVGVAVAAQWVARTRTGTAFISLMLTAWVLVMVTAYSWPLVVPVDWKIEPVVPFVAAGVIGGVAIIVSALGSLPRRDR